MYDLTKESSILFTMSMTSREITQATGKEHKHVVRDIKKLISDKVIDQSNFGRIFTCDFYGRKQPGYRLDFDATMMLITGYDAKRRMAVIKRWRELEQGKATPAFQVPQSLSEALLLAGQLALENERMLEETLAKTAQIEEMQPRVDYADTILESEGSLNLTSTAKSLYQLISHCIVHQG